MWSLLVELAQLNRGEGDSTMLKMIFMPFCTHFKQLVFLAWFSYTPLPVVKLSSLDEIFKIF